MVSEATPLQVAIIGTGYVGLTTGICLAFLGHRVTCLDTDQAKIDTLRQGRIPIYEPWLPELMAAAGERLRFTTSYSEALAAADVVFIAVGTPSSADGTPDLRYLRSAAWSIGEVYAGAHLVVVNKSTVPIGSGNWVGALLEDAFEATHGRAADGLFSVASNPEFLREGSALADSLYPDRVVIGGDDPRALAVLRRLYRPLLEQSFAAPEFLPRPAGFGTVALVATDLASAELIKYAANAFLALKISYVNEIGALAEKVGADIRQVALGVGLDSRIGAKFLQAGIGWGGSCFGKDTAALISTSHEYGMPMPIVQAAKEVNSRQLQRVIEKLQDELKILKGRTIGVLGLAFKPNTDDLRDSPAIAIVRELLARGCKVKVHDPVALERFGREYKDLPVLVESEAAGVVQRADAVVLATEWKEYMGLPWETLAPQMRQPIVLDGRNVLDGKTLAGCGIRYVSMSGSVAARLTPVPA